MALLPMNVKDPGGHPTKPDNARMFLRFVARKYLVFGLTGFVAFTLLLRMLYFRPEVISERPPAGQDASAGQEDRTSPRWPGVRLPPLYSQYHEYELSLPQHHWRTSSHEAEPKFFFVPGHSRGSGWGNIMQELLVNAYLAYKTNRAFVFYNYTWNDNPFEDYTDYSGKPIPSRVPLTALIRGPIVGEPFPPGQHAPLAIAEQYWHTVCDGRTVSIDREEVHKGIGSWMIEPVTKGWMAKLVDVDDQCVAVSDGSAIYDWILFGDRHALHDAWADFAASPILTHFGWSPLVELAFDNNREVISPAAVSEPPLSSSPYTSNAERYTELAGLLVLHLRRGDYEDHCEHLAKWSSTFLAFNALPQLEQFEPPAGGTWGENTPENHAIYREHCFPSVAQIVARVRAVQQSDAARGLDKVYIMTNGAVPWVDELKAALKSAGGFAHVASSRDLVLNWEQKYVAQAMDMLVGQRAQVFIGNGWSSLTGGIVVMRTANRFHPDTTRFF